MAPPHTYRSSLLVLGAIAFGPGLLILYAMLIPFVFAVLFASRSSAGIGFEAGLPDLIALSSTIILPPLCAFLAARAARRAMKCIHLVLAIYVGLLPTALAIALLIAASIAGVSMAVADGTTGGWTLKVQELQFAIVLPAPMHVVILPWVALASLILHRLSARPVSREPSEVT
jgi:hypothetical protein